MIFGELTESEFQSFAEKHKQKNFYQTIYMYHHLKTMNNEVYLVGLKKDDQIICATLIAVSDITLGKKTFHALKGFLIDYKDQELLNHFTNDIKSFIRTKNGFRLIIEPYVPLIKRDSDANIVEGGFDNRICEENLLKLGYNYIDIGSQVKWVYALDINGKTSEEIFNTFRPNTRNYINRTKEKYQLNYRTLNYEELHEFKQITSDTCERRSFSDKSLAYYESMYKEFKDLVTFKVVELNCDTYLEALVKENVEYESKINELSDSASNKKKKATMQKELENNQKKIEDTKKLKEEKGNIIPLSGAMFVLYGNEVIYLFSGSYKEYMNFCGQYRIQWEIIKYAAENNYQRYNFFGIKDPFDKNNKDYGVYEFKKSFNGYVEELMGPYEIGVTNFYKLFSLLRKIRNIIKK